MPEQLTKHPEVTLQVLRSAGAQCGEGAPQTILTQCPAARFCKLPGGEVCIYGLDEAPRMTQISASDWQAVQQLRAGGSAWDGAPGVQGWLFGGVGLLVGVLLGVAVTRLKQRSPPAR